MVTDGGYYAIKGFEFQFDKAILMLLQHNDYSKPIYLEKIQDINDNDSVMQIKYKETQDFTCSKIKEPVLKLLDEYEIGQNKVYCLYCHFKDRPATEETVDICFLNKILGKDSVRFSDELKTNFVKQFKLIFAPTFQEQFDQVINELQKDNFCDCFDEAFIYYSMIVDYLRKIVVNSVNPKDRFCTRENITSLINNGKNLIFNSAFRDWKGDQQYFKYIKNKCFDYRAIDNWERFIVIDLGGEETMADIKSTVYKIKGKFYKAATRAIKSGAPYIYFKNITAEKLKQLKTDLLDEGCFLKDGYDFKNADFSKKRIIEKSTTKNKIQLKFINKEDSLLALLNEDLNCKKEVYQFFLQQPVDVSADIENVRIHIRKISDIIEILG